MKSNRTFRHIFGVIAATLGIMSAPKSRSYPTPTFAPLGTFRGNNSSWNVGKSKKRLQMPDFRPGTITYFDWLVRELGYDRRLADGYMYAFLNGYKVKMPMPSDLVAI